MIPTQTQLENTIPLVSPWVHSTPVLTSRLFNERSGAHVFFKCENFQKTGSFKMRGAVSAVRGLSKKQKAAGVVTHSSGNFAQALAFAAKSMGVKAHIVMPENAPKVKKEAVAGYDGIIAHCSPTLKAREAAAAKIETRTGATFIHSSNNTNVILGNATAAIELLRAQPYLDCLLCPVGGGGLLAGTALAVAHYGKNCKTLAGEPAAADDAYRSLKSGSIQTNKNTNTMADGLCTQLGDKNFPIIKKHVTAIVRVEETEIVAAMKFIWGHLKIIIEPSSAVPVAAMLKEPLHFAGKKVGVILSGGNVDLKNLPF